MPTTSLNSQSELAFALNDCSIDAIIATDSHWKILAWNTAAEHYHERNRDQALGRHLMEVIPEIENDAETVEAIHMAMKGFKTFVPASRHHPFRMHIENHFIPLKDETSGFIGVMNIAHDVTHRIKAERQLQITNRQLERTLDELAAFTMQSSNNIKTPIRHIYTSLEHIVKTEARELSNTAKASFRKIQSSLNRMDLLLDDLLRLSRIQFKDGKKEAVELEEIFLPVLSSLKQKIEETNADIQYHDLQSIKGDKEQLQVLFYHLFDNALKFTTRTPKISITCEEVTLPLNGEGVIEQRYVKTSVTDNGIGMSPDDTERIFNMFEKLHPANVYKGSGTGLAISKKVMDAHGGFFQVETEPGVGSTFHCFFPSA
jgi:PAS domain S-box-containing protein